MKRATLLSTVAATLLLSAGVASAQNPKPEGAAPAPAAQQNAPAEKVAPAMKPGEQKPAEQKAGAEQKPATVGQAPAPKASDADKPRAADEKGGMDKGKTANDVKPADPKAATDTKTNADVKTKASETKPDDKANATKSTQTEKSSTTGQGAAGAAKLSAEQRTKISTVIKQQKVERVDAAKLNISINVGTRIPERGVHFYPLPREVVVIYPEWRGYDYILVGDQVLVVDPRTHEIVAILDA